VVRRTGQSPEFRLPLDYDQFIAEIRELLEQGRSLFDVEEVRNDPVFRRWRKRLLFALHSIEDKGHKVPCQAESRSFSGSSYAPLESEHIRAYRRDLRDTLDELRFLVDNYAKYGEPPVTLDITDQNPIQTPEKVPLVRMSDRLNTTGWLIVTGIVLAIFGVAFALGHWLCRTGLTCPGA